MSVKVAMCFFIGMWFGFSLTQALISGLIFKDKDVSIAMSVSAVASAFCWGIVYTVMP